MANLDNLQRGHVALAPSMLRALFQKGLGSQPVIKTHSSNPS
jgi:hypothetical protein